VLYRLSIPGPNSTSGQQTFAIPLIETADIISRLLCLLNSTMSCRGACAKRLCDLEPVLVTSTAKMQADFDDARTL